MSLDRLARLSERPPAASVELRRAPPAPLRQDAPGQAQPIPPGGQDLTWPQIFGRQCPTTTEPGARSSGRARRPTRPAPPGPLRARSQLRRREDALGRTRGTTACPSPSATSFGNHPGNLHRSSRFLVALLDPRPRSTGPPNREKTSRGTRTKRAEGHTKAWLNLPKSRLIFSPQRHPGEACETTSPRLRRFACQYPRWGWSMIPAAKEVHF